MKPEINYLIPFFDGDAYASIMQRAAKYGENALEVLAPFWDAAANIDEYEAAVKDWDSLWWGLADEVCKAFANYCHMQFLMELNTRKENWQAAAERLIASCYIVTAKTKSHKAKQRQAAANEIRALVQECEYSDDARDRLLKLWSVSDFLRNMCGLKVSAA